jgi:hypothetical protein
MKKMVKYLLELSLSTYPEMQLRFGQFQESFQQLIPFKHQNSIFSNCVNANKLENTHPKSSKENY